MTLAALQAFILRRRGAVLAVLVVVLAATAALLAASVIGQARQLAAGSPPEPSPTPAVSHHEHHPAPSATAQPSTVPITSPPAVPTPMPTPVPTPAATPEPDAPWVQTASFGDDTWSTGVMDVEVWENGFVAVGTTWDDGNPQPRMWRSADGRSWSEVDLSLGSAVALEVVAPLADGRVMVLGTVGGTVDFWSDPGRAAAWASADGVTWSPVPLPFGPGTQGGPVDFAAGAKGLVATTGDDVWLSVDGSSWRQVYDAPQGSMVYGPLAGDDGWILRSSNASLATTTLLVSGDAVTWHEVDLGNVATLANVAGDWLASRATDDWQSTEILRSANGLDWSVVLDLNDLAAPDGSDSVGPAGIGGGAMLSGTSDVMMLSPWRAGHCGGMPSGGWGAWWSTDGTSWSPTGLGGDAVVMHTLAAGGVTVLAGYTADDGNVAFWASR